ncbi:MAG: glycosyltransferase family 39 protein, partial [Anaerolineae bacterium]|nr:glycosyltransferase family 39 protein [Anaerolineae bacterium]
MGAPSLWYDELLELDIAQGPFSAIGPQLPRHAAMPLDYYLMYGWVRMGRQDFWVRWPALFFGVLSIPLTYALARRLFNRRVGYIAALLMTVALFAVRYSQETRPYALLLC